MNILFHTSDYPPWPGGLSAYVRNMTAALADHGHHVVVATSRHGRSPEYEQKGEVIVRHLYDRNQRYSGMARDAVLGVCKEHAIDCIEGADHLADCAPLIKEKRRPPIMVKCHSCSVLRAAHEGAHVIYSWQTAMIKAARLRGWKQARQERYAIEHADLLVGTTQQILDIMGYEGFHLPPQQAVIPNPISPTLHVPSNEAECPTLLFVGRLDIGKGIQYLPHLLRFLLPSFPDLRLEIAGPDSYARGLGSMKKWLIRKLGKMMPSVSLLGHLNSEELESAYARAWVVIVPSRWDTFPTVLLEAMARGKAIVASNRGGIPEMLSQTDGYSSDPSKSHFSDQVLSLLSDKQLRQRVGVSCKNKVEKEYAPAAIVKSYEEVVRSLLNS